MSDSLPKNWNNGYSTQISLTSLIQSYAAMQKQVVDMVSALATNISSTDPGQFLLVQFGMSQVNQVGQSLSNIIYQVNSVCMGAVRNQKVQ